MATPALLELQLAEAVKSWVLPSVKVPAAVNCCVVPRAMKGIEGFTVIETKAAVFTVSVVDFEIEPEVAEMVEVPVASPVARPCPPTPLLIVTTELSDELHCTELVMFCMLPSLKVPFAVNC